MKRKLQFEVVPECDYTDFSHGEKRTVGNSLLIGSAIAGTASLSTYAITRIINKTSTTITTLPPIEPITDPLNVLATPPISVYSLDSMTPEMIPTGFIADASLNMLATVLDPLVQILVAISFPIASVIMVGACFFFMLGNSAGLGYVLIQMSPLLLKILREIGNAV